MFTTEWHRPYPYARHRTTVVYQQDLKGKHIYAALRLML
jgi:hypothetical protein